MLAQLLSPVLMVRDNTLKGSSYARWQVNIPYRGGQHWLFCDQKQKNLAVPLETAVSKVCCAFEETLHRPKIYIVPWHITFPVM